MEIVTIFSNENFNFVKKIGIGMGDTPYTKLDIISSGAAEKHMVRIDLFNDGIPAFDGKPVQYKYNPDRTNVAHGIRSGTDTFADTQELIDTLQDALSFAKRVNEWLESHDEWVRR